MKLELKRSLVNNMFLLTKGPNRSVSSFHIYGPNTSYQLSLAITNTYSDPIEITYGKVVGRTTGALITTFNSSFKLYPSEPTTLRFQEIHLTDADSLINTSLLSGQLLLTVETTYGSVSLPVNGVCFMGAILPDNDKFYLAGSDSSCIKYELNAPEGVGRS